ncbi:M56 family metallopeptidase [Frankia sp. R82]|uniref:M56 family metallopeptidase n=1 Tax=Frankia sp. R82 TaxID=2950553 RepID=UPI002043FEB4|nr:M56 family metallopeptidase [Frankia sp. R82]MCM3883481.1 M56 family metallopeptidase [Frankia sp. R82]
MTTAALLALFAGALAWPIPRLLAAARWPHRYPRAAILLWQAIGLAGGVSALLAAIAFTVSPLATSTPSAITDHVANVAAGEPLAGLRWINLVGLALATALAGRLFGVLGASTAATLRERHRHRHLVDLAGRRHRSHDTSPHDHSTPNDRHAPNDRRHREPGGEPSYQHHGTRHDIATDAVGGTGGDEPEQDEDAAIRAVTPCCLCEHRDRAGIRLRILDHPIAVAYCVPGVRHARVVVSRGLLNTLSADELDAVLAHEAAHVAGRHDLVIQPFVAWERTFPFLGPAREATAAVSLLVEMLADDAAGRRTSRRALARALARIGVTRTPVPAGALGILGAHGHITDAAVLTTGTGATGTTTHREPAGAGSSRGVTNPVISRIARLLDPPTVHWWQALVAYLAALAVLVTPPLIVLIG